MPIVTTTPLRCPSWALLVVVETLFGQRHVVCCDYECQRCSVLHQLTDNVRCLCNAVFFCVQARALANNAVSGVAAGVAAGGCCGIFPRRKCIFVTEPAKRVIPKAFSNSVAAPNLQIKSESPWLCKIKFNADDTRCVRTAHTGNAYSCLYFFKQKGN